MQNIALFYNISVKNWQVTMFFQMKNLNKLLGCHDTS